MFQSLVLCDPQAIVHRYRVFESNSFSFFCYLKFRNLSDASGIYGDLHLKFQLPPSKQSFSWKFFESFTPSIKQPFTKPFLYFYWNFVFCFLSGLFFIVPFIDSCTKVDLRTVSFDVPPQEVRSRTLIATTISQSFIILPSFGSQQRL